MAEEAGCAKDLRHMSRCGGDEVWGQRGTRHRHGKVKYSVCEWDSRSPQTLRIQNNIICFTFPGVGYRKSL